MKLKTSKFLVEEALKEIKTLELTDVKELIDKKACTLIDLRDVRELYNEGGVAGALHIPRGMLEFWIDKESPYYQKGRFSEDKQIILFCTLGARSALAAKTLQEMGYTNVSQVKGGYRAMSGSGNFQLIKIKKK
jgi:rhodanese-related sulfurtransferase